MGTDMHDSATRILFGRHATARAGAGAWALLLACVALLGWKAWSLGRLNVNWDEFYFLNHVHALLRGELELPFQTAFTQVFRWLPWAGDGELAQIHAARTVMFLLLVIAVAQILRLAARWATPAAAAVAAIAFLCTLSTQMHGASFRSDSLMLPLVLGALLLLTRPVPSRGADVLAGVLCGVGIAISVKMALFAPLFLACLLLGPNASGASAGRWRGVAWRAVLIGVVTLVVAVALIAAHQATLQVPELESAGSFADRSLGKTILETKFLPGEFYLRRQLRADRFVWILLGVGLVVALWRRRWIPAAMALSLTPILFYRNTFPYFYVLMLAPAMLLVALVVDEVRGLARRGAAGGARDWVPVASGVLLLVHGGSRLPLLSSDEQAGQRDILQAVHRIFPQPVPYIDHAGMVSTFPKVNFFMSTWGMEEYRRRGEPFMPRALRDHRPPLLLINRDYLNPYMRDFGALMPVDRELLVRFYQPYWGPISIAGASVQLTDERAQEVALPFPGGYRLEASQPVLIDGQLRAPGDVVEVTGQSVRLARSAADPNPLPVRLLWAAAGPRPAESPDIRYIFTGL